MNRTTKLKSLIERMVRREVKRQTLRESNDTMYAVVLLGGSIGSRPIRNVRELRGKDASDETLYTKEEAIEKRKRMNKILSAGEKKYYKMKYEIVPVINGKFA